MNRILNNLRQTSIYPLLTSFPWTPYRGAVLGLIDAGHESILEAGCGTGNLIRSLRFPREIPVKIGVDIFPDSVRQAQETGLYTSVRVGDVRALPFEDKSIDCVLCVEVIEHMPKEEGYSVIRELERIAIKQVIISTTDIPLGENDPAQAPDGNLFMYHQARWKPWEFEECGYTVYGMYPRFTEGSSNDPVYFLSYILPLMWLVKNAPHRAKAFTAVKRF